MQEYIKGALTILNNGSHKNSARDGMVSTKSYTALQLRFDLSKGVVPILTTKKMPFRIIMAELLWMLRGDTNIKALIRDKCHIWDDNAWKWYNALLKYEGLDLPKWDYETFIEEACKEFPRKVVRANGSVYTVGDLGKIYGHQWRHTEIDQIQQSLAMLIGSPNSRQNKVVAWRSEDMTYEHCAQPNCHGDFQITTRELDGAARIKILKSRLKVKSLTGSIDEINEQFKTHRIPKHEFTLHLSQRSGDYALGIPFNITSYAMLMYIFGILSNTIPKMLIVTIGDAHVYTDHINTLRYDQCRLEPKPLPTFTIKGKTWEELASDVSPVNNYLDSFLDNVTPDDFKLEGYQSHGTLQYLLHTGTVSIK